MLCVGITHSAKVVPAEMTRRPVRLQHVYTRVLGYPDGKPITLVNYTMNCVGYHFDFLHILGGNPFLENAELQAP